MFSTRKLMIILLGLSCSAPSLLSAADLPYVPHEVIVVYKEGASTDKTLQSYQTVKRFSNISRIRKAEYRLLKSTTQTTDEMIQQLSKDPNVLRVEPNYIKKVHSTIPNDPYFDDQWGLRNTGQVVNRYAGTADADIDADEAWDTTQGSRDVVVAVVDTGIDYTHEDLKENIWINQKELNGQAGVDDDGNGYIDDIYGYDFADDDNDPMDEDGHGSHVAGIIGAVGDNSIGVSGVNWNVSLMALKVEDSSDTISNSYIFDAFDYLLDLKQNQNVNIVAVNASYGGSQYSQTEKDYMGLLADAGIILVAAAGNDGKDIDSSPEYPASYDDDNIIAVAATDQDDNLPDWSNYGVNDVDLAAPGDTILSTTPGDDYAYYTGTSMATPFVTGAVAFLKSWYTDDTYSETRRRILDNVDQLASLKDKVATGGRLNLNKSLSSTLGNRAPVANDDSVTTDVNISVTIDVLANDSDADNDPLTITEVTSPLHGKVVINSDQTLTYTPDSDYTGTDSFQYTIDDGNGGTDSATVTVTITGEESSVSTGGGGGGGPALWGILFALATLLWTGSRALAREEKQSF